MNINIILDTKIFVLFMVGLIDENYIGRFIGTKEFEPEDYRNLMNNIKNFGEIIVTPHILTEFSHHTIEKKGFRDDYKKKLISLLTNNQGKNIFQESGVDSFRIFSNSGVFYLGVADVSLLELCDKNSIVITSDGPLADKLRSQGKNAYKFLPTEGFVNY